MRYPFKALQLARIARGALSFKCKAPIDAAQSPRSLPSPAHKSAPLGSTAIANQRWFPRLARLRAKVDSWRRGATSTGLPFPRHADRPVAKRRLSRSSKRPRVAPQATTTCRHLPVGRNGLPATVTLAPWLSPVRGIPPKAGISQRTRTLATQAMGDVMRLTFKLHDTSPPFVELCLETWRQDVHGGAPIISPHLTSAREIRQSCANFRAQIDRVERQAIAALAAKKKTP
jgi:hypothetical protein